jgi:hypothetical protein
MDTNAFVGGIIFCIIGGVVANWHWSGWIGVALGVLAILGSFNATKYYCADCGQYIGTQPGTCSRCGCNRYTDEDTGVGRTTRNR